MKKTGRVILVPCKSYEPEQVYWAMRIGIQQLGGLRTMIRPEERILVKPNFLSPAAPEKAVTTHPAVIAAMFRILSEEGYKKAAYGDSPGHGSCEGAARKLGLEQAAQRYGIVRANMEDEVLTEFPEGRTAKSFYFAKGVTEADALISLCKMKTHALERVTGAVKNVYGLICGPRKAAGHVKYPNAGIFARMLADIHRSRDIRLHIMDGIVAMEGNGPGSGDPTPMGVLLFSQDPVALDTVFCRLVNLDPELVPTCVQGQAMGIGTCRMQEIEVVEAIPGEAGLNETISGEAEKNGMLPGEVGRNGMISGEAEKNGILPEKAGRNGMISGEAEKNGMLSEEAGRNGMSSGEDGLGGTNSGKRNGVSVRILTEEELMEKYGNPHFRVDRDGQPRGFLGQLSQAAQHFTRRPVIRKDLCVRCGICVSHCPVPGGAVTFRDGKEHPPVYDYRKCIRCYCCQEMCPQHAISVGGKKRERAGKQAGQNIRSRQERDDFRN